MGDLRVGATVRELIPGRPDEIEALAGRMGVLGTGLSAAAAELRAIDAGEWVGEAADAFRSVVGDEPDKYDTAGSAFQTAAGASRGFADVLRQAQGRAADAIDLFESAASRTSTWRSEVDRYERAQRAADDSTDQTVIDRAEAMSYPGGDPGAADREEARAILSVAQGDVREEGDRVCEQARSGLGGRPQRARPVRQGPQPGR